MKMRKTNILSVVPLALLVITCSAYDDVTGEREREVEEIHSVIKELETNLVENVNRKYSKPVEILKNYKRIIQGSMENEKQQGGYSGNVNDVPRVPHREIEESPRIPHRELNDIPRMPHRELNEVPRMPHREISESTRMLRRKMKELLSMPHREMGKSPRLPHREMNELPGMPHREMNELPRMPHREIGESLQMQHREMSESPRILHREMNEVPRVPHRKMDKLQRRPHKDTSNVFEDKNLLDRIKLELLREIVENNSTADKTELQDRSGACTSKCIGVFDACLNSPSGDVITHFFDCKEQEEICFNKHKSCL